MGRWEHKDVQGCVNGRRRTSNRQFKNFATALFLPRNVKYRPANLILIVPQMRYSRTSPASSLDNSPGWRPKCLSPERKVDFFRRGNPCLTTFNAQFVVLKHSLLYSPSTLRAHVFPELTMRFRFRHSFTYFSRAFII